MGNAIVELSNPLLSVLAVIFIYIVVVGSLKDKPMAKKVEPDNTSPETLADEFMLFFIDTKRTFNPHPHLRSSQKWKAKLLKVSVKENSRFCIYKLKDDSILSVQESLINYGELEIHRVKSNQEREQLCVV